MGHDVFISHSSLDKLAADAVCHGLEAKGIRCWIAPRDQIAGRAYGEQITAAIESAQVVVLVFSDNVNKSQAVLNEINIAAGANVTIVPFRLAAVEFNSELHFYLGRMHWLDAFPQPIDAYIDTLVTTIRRNLKPAAPGETPTVGAAAAVAVAPDLAAATQPAQPSPSGPPPSLPPPSAAVSAPPPKADMRPLAIIGGVFGVVLLIALVIALSPHPAPAPGRAASNTVEAALTNRIVNEINSSNDADDKDDDAAKSAAAGGAQPPRGDGSETTPVRAANDQAMTYYETELAPNGPPAALDGATVISTSQLVASLKDRDAGRAPFWLVDARGCTSEPTIPTATCVNSLGELEQKSPDKATQIVVFCHDGSCPMSYVLASQAVAAGYTDVFWYRGGVNAWMAAGYPSVNEAQP